MTGHEHAHSVFISYHAYSLSHNLHDIAFLLESYPMNKRAHDYRINAEGKKSLLVELQH